MADFATYPSHQIPYDFELYAQNQEQQFDLHTTQPCHASSSSSSSSSLGFHPSLPSSYTTILPFSDPSIHQHLHYHYDAMAYDPKPFPYHTPAGSPQSTPHSFHDQPPPILSASSESSTSVASSVMSSPLPTTQPNEPWIPVGLGIDASFEFPAQLATEKAFIDPNLVQPFAFAPPSPYPDLMTAHSPYFPVVDHPPSPALSYLSVHSPHTGPVRTKQESTSPHLHAPPRYHPYPHQHGKRSASIASLHSQHSHTSRKSGASTLELDEARDKGMCPLPDCGRVFKDLKAHMLTHQNERPEKCPITTCEYNAKGFARKYDKNRHTLTHYKGTMVCGFCPGSGSAAEKSFNRADVFKRHLTSVHGVEQTPPNSRKKSLASRKSTATFQSNVPGTCSTCSVTFPDAQEFYEHLDDCVLRVVQQADPTEAIHQRLLGSVVEDKAITKTLDGNGPTLNNTNNHHDDDEQYDNKDAKYPDQDNANSSYASRCFQTDKGRVDFIPNHL